MIVPARIKIFNQTIKIVYRRNLLEKEKAFGIWNYSKNTIYLQQSTRKNPLTKEQIHQTLVHELLHACLDLMGEEKLSSNEKLISSLSNLIYQVIEQI